jgi:hypothetical protein
MIDPTENESDDVQSANPAYEAPFSVSISFPEDVTIRMVDASSLNDYEAFLFFTGLFCNIACGFAVTAISSADGRQSNTTIAAIFVVLTVGFFGWALFKRRAMSKKAKSFKLKTSNVVEVDK